MRQSLKDRDYDGQDYVVDQNLMDGPLGERRCTDCLFLIIFIAFLGAMGYISNIAMKNGKPD